MSKSNAVRMQPEPIEPTMVSEDIPGDAIIAFINTAPEAVYLRRDPVQREAFWSLVTTPYESADINEACHRVAAILELMSRPRSEIIAEAFQRATYEAGKDCGGRP